MPKVTEDVISGAGLTEAGTGPTVARTFIVENVFGAPDAKVDIAINAGKIPKLGEVHPRKSNIFCVSRRVKFIDSETAQVTANYEVPDVLSGQPPPGSTSRPAAPTANPLTATNNQGTITVAASGTTSSVTEDINGTDMLVAHDVETRKPVVDSFGRTRSVQTAVTRVEQKQTAQVTRPSVILRVQRIESGSPDQKARAFVGTVNSTPLDRDAAGTWLCTRIDGTSNDGGNEYNVTYEFQYNPRGWFFVAEWIDPDTGLPLDSSKWNTNEEKVAFEVYDSADFSALGITFTKVIGGKPLVVGTAAKAQLKAARRAKNPKNLRAPQAPSAFWQIFI